MKRTGCLAAALLLCALLTGCFMRSPGELYAVPKQSEEYFNLQQAIDAVMEKTSYSAPVSGDNRQAVQLKDLDGDGVNEAILFAKADGDNPLKIYIFRREGTVFSQLACLEGAGVNFDMVSFAQIDGEEGLEMVVGRQLGEGVIRSLSVYRLRDGEVTELLSTSYNQMQIVDLNEDGRDDVFLLREQTGGGGCNVRLYHWQDGQLRSSQQQMISAMSVENLRRIQLGITEDDAPAVFLEGVGEEENPIAEVYVMRSGELCTLLPDGWMDSEEFAAAQGRLSFQDIDNDGVMELPQLQLQQTGGGQTCYLVRWYSLKRDGSSITKLYTVQSAEDNWYVELRWQQEQQLSLHCEVADGMHKTTVSRQTGQGSAPAAVLFSIYALTGDDREALAQSDGRFQLCSAGDAAFAASIGAAGRAQGLTQEQLTAQFHLISEPEE